jgi:hypothetical protein
MAEKKTGRRGLAGISRVRHMDKISVMPSIAPPAPRGDGLNDN